MKNILALVLMVFGLVGCVTALKTSNYASHQTVEDNVYHYEKIVESYEDIQWASWQEVYKSEAMSIETGERYFRDYLLNQWVTEDSANVVSTFDYQTKATCEKLFKSKCVITRSNNFTDSGEKVYWISPTEYKLVQIAKKKENTEYQEKVLQNEKLLKERALKREEQRKKKILADLHQRCEEYGFTGESNISACIQREAQHDKELAMQKYELEKTRLALQQAQSRTYAQNVTEPVQKEEDLPFLIKFLGDVAMGVAENLADPAFQRDMQQQRQINELKANQNRDIYRDCRPNC